MLSTRRIFRIIIALIIVIAYAVWIQPYFQINQNKSSDVSREISDLTKPPQPYTFQIPMYFSFNGSIPFLRVNESDFEFLLNITYPYGTLVTNETVYINATAVYGQVVTTLDYVGIIFPNALNSPITYDEHNLPRQGILIFPNPISVPAGSNIISENNYVETDANIKWPIEGDYVPIIGFFFKDGTNKIYSANNVVIHVYPKEQLTQIETNRVSLENNQASLELSKAVLILSTVAILALAFQIVDHTDSECKYRKK